MLCQTGLTDDANHLEYIRPIMKSKDATWLVLFESKSVDGTSLVERVCQTVRKAVSAGHLRRGDRLPASRVLAIDLEVSRITVEAAYGRLEAEGYVVRKVGSGTFVAIDAAPLAQRHLASMTTAVGLSARGSALVATGGCVDSRVARAFTAGFPDPRAFPIDVWRRLIAKAMRGDPAELFSYGDPLGLPSLREAISAYLFQSRGVRCSPDRIMVTTSSQQALSLIANLLVDPGDNVWVEDPCYPGARTAFLGAGSSLHGIPVDSDGMLLPSITSVPRVIYLTPSNQYPTGATLSLERRLQLLRQPELKASWIVEDDYDSEFQYQAKAVPALQGLDQHGRVIYVGTFTKALFPSLRLGYMVLPPSLVEAFVTARTTLDGHPAYLSQAVTAQFLSQGHFSAHVRQMRRLYKSRHDCLIEELGRFAPRLERSSSAGAGLQSTVFVEGLSDMEFARKAPQAGIELRCLSPLYLNSAKRQGWILGFAALENETIRSSLRRLGKMLR
jgi:GntR family transcriptional regulator/MocR family aminotransferase